MDDSVPFSRCHHNGHPSNHVCQIHMIHLFIQPSADMRRHPQASAISIEREEPPEKRAEKEGQHGGFLK